jgi:hypothetical protein
MDRVVPTSRAEFLQLQPVLLLLLVLRRRVIAVLALAALQSNDFAHKLAFSFQPSALSSCFSPTGNLKNLSFRAERGISHWLTAEC